MENKDEQLDAIICDKTQFICGTPMQARDRLCKRLRQAVQDKGQKSLRRFYTMWYEMA